MDREAINTISALNPALSNMSSFVEQSEQITNSLMKLIASLNNVPLECVDSAQAWDKYIIANIKPPVSPEPIKIHRDTHRNAKAHQDPSILNTVSESAYLPFIHVDQLRNPEYKRYRPEMTWREALQNTVPALLRQSAPVSGEQRLSIGKIFEPTNRQKMQSSPTLVLFFLINQSFPTLIRNTAANDRLKQNYEALLACLPSSDRAVLKGLLGAQTEINLRRIQRQQLQLLRPIFRSFSKDEQIALYAEIPNEEINDSNLSFSKSESTFKCLETYLLDYQPRFFNSDYYQPHIDLTSPESGLLTPLFTQIQAIIDEHFTAPDRLIDPSNIPDRSLLGSEMGDFILDNAIDLSDKMPLDQFVSGLQEQLIKCMEHTLKPQIAAFMDKWYRDFMHSPSDPKVLYTLNYTSSIQIIDLLPSHLDRNTIDPSDKAEVFLSSCFRSVANSPLTNLEVILLKGLSNASAYRQAAGVEQTREIVLKLFEQLSSTPLTHAGRVQYSAWSHTINGILGPNPYTTTESLPPGIEMPFRESFQSILLAYAKDDFFKRLMPSQFQNFSERETKVANPDLDILTDLILKPFASPAHFDRIAKGLHKVTMQFSQNLFFHQDFNRQNPFVIQQHNVYQTLTEKYVTEAFTSLQRSTSFSKAQQFLLSLTLHSFPPESVISALNSHTRFNSLKGHLRKILGIMNYPITSHHTDREDKTFWKRTSTLKMLESTKAILTEAREELRKRGFDLQRLSLCREEVSPSLFLPTNLANLSLHTSMGNTHIGQIIAKCEPIFRATMFNLYKRTKSLAQHWKGKPAETDSFWIQELFMTLVSRDKSRVPFFTRYSTLYQGCIKELEAFEILHWDTDQRNLFPAKEVTPAKPQADLVASLAIRNLRSLNDTHGSEPQPTTSPEKEIPKGITPKDLRGEGECFQVQGIATLAAASC